MTNACFFRGRARDLEGSRCDGASGLACLGLAWYRFCCKDLSGFERRCLGTAFFAFGREKNCLKISDEGYRRTKNLVNYLWQGEGMLGMVGFICVVLQPDYKMRKEILQFFGSG